MNPTPFSLLPSPLAGPRAWARVCAALLTVAFVSQAAAKEPAVQRLSYDAFTALAFKAETSLYDRMDGPLLVAFFRKQGFRFGRGAQAARVVPLEWTHQSEGMTHCELHVFHGDQAQAIDLLAPDTDRGWSCDGEPALAFKDVDGDGCLDMVAMAPYRPPSGESFMQTVVVTCEPGGRSHKVDVARTSWIEKAVQNGRAIDSLKDAVRLLQSYQGSAQSAR